MAVNNRLYLTVLATVKAPCSVSIGENVQMCRFLGEVGARPKVVQLYHET